MLVNKFKISDLSDLEGYLTIPISSNFSPETQQYENVETYFNFKDSDIINPTIDYEKLKISPIYLSGSTTPYISHLDSLKFNLHFYIGSTWSINTTKLSEIGFTKEDVSNKRNKLSKSFLRLSFYDSMDLKTQNLLFYSTIFVDSDDMYGQYLNTGVTFSNIGVSFSVENPKLSKKIKSFEGYNIYLFKDELSKTTKKSIYMRVDFNNASNGRSILFTRRDATLNNNGYTMKEIHNMMFFEIVCEFNENMNQYVWYFKDLIGKKLETSNTDDPYVKNVLNIELNQAKVI